MSYKAITKESYEATAEKFAGNVAELAPLASIEKFIRLLPDEAKIIDIGCGSGRDAKIFTEKGVDVLGIDFCSNLIEIAKKNAPLAEFQVMDIETLDFPDASFDGVWAAASLLHIPKIVLPDVFKKIHAILKENGYFYLTLKKGAGEVLEKDSRYGDFQKFWSYFEEDELKEFLEAAHFKIIDFTVVKKHHAYLTHDGLRAICQKESV